MPNSTVSSASEGLPKVLQTLLSRRERVQLHRRDVEILHGLQANVQDRPSAYRIPAATPALGCDATSALPPKLCSQKKKHSTVRTIPSIRFFSPAVIRLLAGLDLLEGALAESHTTVIIPFDDRVLFVCSLNRA